MRPYFAALALLAFAAPTQAQPLSPAESDALFERFLSVLPDSHRWRTIDRSPDPAWVEIFGRLNPGREDEIRIILADNRACLSRAHNGAARDLMRDVARRLGDDKVGRMIDLYTGPDLAKLKPLLRRGKLSPAETAELARMKQAYPLDDYHAAFQAAVKGLEDVGAASACSRAAFDRFERAGIRVRRDPPARPARPD